MVQMTALENIQELYSVKFYMSMQIREIYEHRWYRSEQEKKEISMDDAFQDWAKNQAARFREAYFRNINRIRATCKEKCNDRCQGVKGCVLEMNEIHRLLGDN